MLLDCDAIDLAQDAPAMKETVHMLHVMVAELG
jgi:hypothetical protein